MSNIDKRALREAAEKATPGRWEYYPGNTSIEYNVDSMDEDQGSIVYVDSGDFTQKQTDLNGAFIAAANPTTVLALLDELEAKNKRIAELEAREVKLPAEKFCPAEYAGSQLWEETEIWNKAVQSCEDAIRAAGIKFAAAGKGDAS
ncbi:TPA: ead/Ea22-like family protein [Enterobacter hormaechei]